MAKKNKRKTKTKNKKTIVLAAGGTGGHLYPCISLAKELNKKKYSSLLITDKRGSSHQHNINKLKTEIIHAGGVAGKNPFVIFISLSKLTVGFLRCLYILYREKPLAVIGFGGYVSIPPLVAAKILRIPIYIHEQNAVLGRANRLMSKHARSALTAFPTVKHLTKEDNIFYGGNPVRSEICEKRKAKKQPKITKEKPINILIFGGSLGAKIFAELIPPALNNLPLDLKERIVVYQQCHEEDLRPLTKKYREYRIKVKLETFIHDMDEKMERAHLIISRSGASTIAELSTIGRPAIFIPLPNSIDNHQFHNAKFFEDNKAGWILEQKNCTNESLSKIIADLFDHPMKLKRASNAAFKLGKGDNAAIDIATFINKDLNKIKREKKDLKK